MSEEKEKKLASPKMRKFARELGVNIDLVIHLADVVAGINYVFANEYSLFNKNISINTNILNASIKNGVKKY